MNNEEQLLILYQNIKFLRKVNGLNQRQMAKICGICVQSLSKIENGNLPPKISTKILFNISNYFNLKVRDLFLPLSETFSS